MFIFCDEQQRESEATIFFKGNHQLSSITVEPDTSKKFEYVPANENEFYILINNKENTVKFMFQNNKNEYMNAVLPHDQIRFIFLPEDSNVQPYCKFRWNPNVLFRETRWENIVVYCVIAIKKSQMYGK
jgi:hypothetical protein